MSFSGLFDKSCENIVRYNETVNSKILRLLIYYLNTINVEFSVNDLLQSACEAEIPSKLTVGQLMNVVASQGLPVRAGSVKFENIKVLSLPFICYLKNLSSISDALEPVIISSISGNKIVYQSDCQLKLVCDFDNFENRWSGIVIYRSVDSKIRLNTDFKPNTYKATMIKSISNFLSLEQCRDIIRCCEKKGFVKSRIVDKVESKFGAVREDIRSSHSVVLDKLDHPEVAFIFNKVALIENIDEKFIENIQCVRYSKSQRFVPHYDSGLKTPRWKTYLVYLNDDFVGGETHFSLLRRKYKPEAGRCLMFFNTDINGKIYWESEHEGRPIKTGVKYALNIWVSLPAAKQCS